ncbi:MAG: site-2 protease family protein [Oscillospiraceae bacterium]|nr:site-2 protease family protein [Oscillospiraceae bacterium]
MEVSVYFAAMLALLCAVGSGRRMLLALLLCAGHECGHIIALRRFRVLPSRIVLTAAGMRMERPPGLNLSFPREILCALAGPAVSFLLGGACWCAASVCPGTGGVWLREAAWLSLGLGGFNLLPVRQLDGGRALYFALCRRHAERAAHTAVQVTSLGCLFFCIFLAALQWLRGGPVWNLLIVTLYLCVSC